MSDVAQKINQQIAAARELLRPSPVRLHHVPRWFARKLRPLKGQLHPRSARYLSGNSLFDEAACYIEYDGKFGNNWLDHWGTTVSHGRPCFVSEPYHVTSSAMTNLDRICELTGLRWYLDPNSWWYPGWTQRIAIYDPSSERQAEGGV